MKRRVVRAYLNIAAGFFIVGKFEICDAVANGVLGHILIAVRASLQRNVRDILHHTQINNQTLVKVRALG